MNKDNITSIVTTIVSILINLIIILFNDEIFIKISLVLSTFLLLLLLHKTKFLKKGILAFISILLLCSCILSVFYGEVRNDNSKVKASYMLNIVDAVVEIQNLKDDKNLTDDDFIVKRGVLKNNETKVEYNFDKQSGLDLMFNDIPLGIYSYEIEFENIEYVYDSKKNIEITAGLLVDNKEDDNYVYKYIKIDEKKAKFSKWSEWSEYTGKEEKPDLLTEVRIKVENEAKQKNKVINEKYYDISKPIYKFEKVKTGSYIENGIEIPTFRTDKVLEGYEIISKKKPIYLYDNVKVTYSFRKRTVQNYNEAVTTYYARHDKNDILLSLGYIKIGRINSSD